jgi:hypothetical protein
MNGVVVVSRVGSSYCISEDGQLLRATYYTLQGINSYQSYTFIGVLIWTHVNSTDKNRRTRCSLGKWFYFVRTEWKLREIESTTGFCCYARPDSTRRRRRYTWSAITMISGFWRPSRIPFRAAYWNNGTTDLFGPDNFADRMLTKFRKHYF